MARWKFQGTTKDQSGRILPSATVSVYLAGTTTAASVYTSVTSATAVNSITSNSTDATYVFYTDCFDYDYDQAFKIIITKSGYTSVTYDNIPHGEIVLGTYTISTAKTVTTYVKIPKGVFYTKSGSGSLAFNGPTEIGLYQVFSGFDTGVTFGPASVKEVVPQWWGASGAATAAVNSAAFQAALDSLGTYPTIPLRVPGSATAGVGTYDINILITKTYADTLRIYGDAGRYSLLRWTGASKGTMLKLTGSGALSGVIVEGIGFDLDDKASVGLEMSGFAFLVRVQDCLFKDGLSYSDTPLSDVWGMLSVPLNGETHLIQIHHNGFSGGNSIAVALGLTGVSSAGAGVSIENNSFYQVKSWAVAGDGLKGGSRIVGNVYDQLYANTTAGGFKIVTAASNVLIADNHMEACYNEFILLNSVGRAGHRASSAMIRNNLFISGNSTLPISFINLGYTDDVLVEGNSALAVVSTSWLNITANALGTIVGKNTVASDLVGSMLWHEQFITGAGTWVNRFATNTVSSTTAVLTLTSQSSSADWVSLTPISTTTEPDIPADARAYIVQASIMSATVGARLYLVNEGNSPLWANRATDIRVQYIEAQTASRYNTATFTIPVKNQSYEDSIRYGISDAGVTDTNVELRIVGYLMPS